MKVEDASKIYEFLSHIQLLGFIGICLLVVLSLLLFLAPKETLWTRRKLSLILILAIVPLVVLYYQSKQNIRLKNLATNIKQDLAFRHFKQGSLKWLNDWTLNHEYNLANEKEKNKLIKKAYELQEMFPDEFLVVPIATNLTDTTEKVGLCVIDSSLRRKNEEAINQNAERMAKLVSTIMLNEKMDTIYININDAREHDHKYSLRQLNDEYYYIDVDFYTAMIGRYGLVPLYIPYTDTSGNVSGYGKIIGFTLIKNIDSQRP